MRSGVGDHSILYSLAGVGAWVSITTRPLRAKPTQGTHKSVLSRAFDNTGMGVPDLMTNT